MINAALMKSIDKIVGRCLCSTLIRPRYGTSYNCMRILIIRPGGIGDAVLLAKSIHSVKKQYPDAHITLLAERRNCGIFSMIPQVDKVFCYDRPRELLQSLLGQYDVVIDTEQWHRLSAVVARFARAPIKIGFETNERRRMFTHGIRYDLDAYESDNFLSLLKPLGINFNLDAEAVTLLCPIQSVFKSNQLLQPLGSDSFIVIFPGASIPERRWGVNRFRRVAELLSDFGIKIVVVGGSEDRQQGEIIAGGELGLNLAGMTSLSETAAIIQKSALLLSGDSGVLHIAAALNIPTVSLFGPGRSKKWAPQGDNHIVVNKQLPCSPCTLFGSTPECLSNAECMRDITIDEVVNAVTVLLVV